jgi:hypothetical protein
MGVWVSGKLRVFNVHVVPVKVHGVIIECLDRTLGHVILSLLFQPIKLLLENLSPSKLKRARYDDGVMSLASIFFRAAMGLAKAFANANVVASDRRGRYELQGIVDTSDGWARRVLNGGLQGHVS